MARGVKRRAALVKAAFGEIESLDCLAPMVTYYTLLRESIYGLLEKGGESGEQHVLSRMPRDQVRELRRYVNADLEQYGIEFYLQRLDWALQQMERQDRGPGCQSCGKEKWKSAHCTCQMLSHTGFARVALKGKNEYPYAEFLKDTLPIFTAMHSHLVSINRGMANLYHRMTELPVAMFSPAGRGEILQLTRQLDRIMAGLLVATHLQPQKPWQGDLVGFLLSRKTDCQRLSDTLHRLYQTHRLRLIIFPIDDVAPNRDPYDDEGTPAVYPISCLPESAGIYMDFLGDYRVLVHHARAIIHWAIRLHSLWYFVPRRVLRSIAPQSAFTD